MSDTTSDLASRAQAREELFRIVAGVCSVTATNEILADFARLAGLLGYVKADGEEFAAKGERAISETRWRSHEEALEGMKRYVAAKTVVRRFVGPWEVVTDAES